MMSHAMLCVRYQYVEMCRGIMYREASLSQRYIFHYLTHTNMVPVIILYVQILGHWKYIVTPASVCVCMCVYVCVSVSVWVCLCECVCVCVLLSLDCVEVWKRCAANISGFDVNPKVSTKTRKARKARKPRTRWSTCPSFPRFPSFPSFRKNTSFPIV